MSAIISVREGPLAVFGETDGKTYLLLGENTLEARQQALLAKQYADGAGAGVELGVQRAMAWAEGANPGGAGTKSAKSWSADTEALYDQSADALDAANVVKDQLFETVEDGVRGDFRISDENLAESSYDVTFARAAGAEGSLQEVIQEGTYLSGGIGGTDASNTPNGFSARFANGTIGADPFATAGKASVRHALPAGFSVNVHEELDAGKYRVVAIDSAGDASSILASASANFRWPAPMGSVISVASDQSDGIELIKYRSYTAGLDGQTLIRQAAATNTERRAFIIVGMGESLMRGGQDNVAAPVPGPYNLGATMMSNGNVFLGNADLVTAVADPAAYANLKPMAEVVNKQEMLGPLARRLFAEDGIPSSVINVGISGRKYAEVRKGTVPYANGLAALAVHIAHWKRHGFTPVPILVFQMGVNDGGSGDSYTLFQPFLSEILNNFTADARALLNDPVADIHMFFATPMSIGGTVNSSWVPGGIADFQYDVLNAHFVGPLIGVANYDTHHPTSVAYVRLGESLYYRAIKRVLVQKSEWKALRPVQGGAIRTDTTSIALPLEGNTGAVRILTDALCPALPNSGIQVWSSAGVERTVSAVSVAPFGSGYALSIVGSSFAANDVITGALSTFAPAGAALNAPERRARTNIADSDPLVGIYDTSNFPKWLGQFREVVA